MYRFPQSIGTRINHLHTPLASMHLMGFFSLLVATIQNFSQIDYLIRAPQHQVLHKFLFKEQNFVQREFCVLQHKKHKVPRSHDEYDQPEHTTIQTTTILSTEPNGIIMVWTHHKSLQEKTYRPIVSENKNDPQHKKILQSKPNFVPDNKNDLQHTHKSCKANQILFQKT